jgi:hypothetical protein
LKESGFFHIPLLTKTPISPQKNPSRRCPAGRSVTAVGANPRKAIRPSRAL